MTDAEIGIVTEAERLIDQRQRDVLARLHPRLSLEGKPRAYVEAAYAAALDAATLAPAVRSDAASGTARGNLRFDGAGDPTYPTFHPTARADAAAPVMRPAAPTIPTARELTAMRDRADAASDTRRIVAGEAWKPAAERGARMTYEERKCFLGELWRGEEAARRAVDRFRGRAA